MILNLDKLQQLQELGYVRIVRDRRSNLQLANYSPQAQFSRAWDEHPILLDCRGIIFDEWGQVVAKPYKKFFNLGEQPGTALADLVPLGRPDVSHKLDGSLCILFRDPTTGATRFATRGSFGSEQALAAGRLWADLYGHVQLDPAYTYLFEYTGPDNRIVVHYPVSRLTLIGLVRTADGAEQGYGTVAAHAERLGLPAVARESGSDWLTLINQERPNFEGYVLHWPAHQLRLKVKLADYVRLHRLITGLNDHVVWEALAAGVPVPNREQLPEELLPWLDMTAARLRGEYDTLLGRVAGCAEILLRDLDPRDRDQRRRIAELVAERVPTDLRGPLWLALDGKDVSRKLWKLVEPKGTTQTGNQLIARALASAEGDA